MNRKSSSNRNYSIIPVFVLMMTVLQGQTPNNVVSDFNLHQQNAYSIIEIEEHIYVAGQALVKGVEPGEREAFIAKYNAELEPLSYSILSDENDFQTFANNARELLHYDGVLYRAYNEGAASDDYGHIAQYHLDSEAIISFHRVQDTLNNLERVGPAALMMDEQNQLVFSLASSLFQDDITIWIQVLEPGTGRLIRQQVFEEVGLSLFCREIVENSKGYLLLGHSFGEDNVRTTFIWQLDHELNILEKVNLDDRHYYHIYLESVLDDGAIVFTNNEHLGNFNNWRSVLIKMDSDLNVVWETTVGSPEYSRDFSYYTGVVKSHDNDGYILCGVNEVEDTLAATRGQIAKISTDGDSVWHRQLRPLEDYEGSTELFDIIQSSDGHYLATGVARNPDALKDSIFIKTWLIKFDEDGHIVTKDSTDSVTSLFNSSLRIFPNPTTDIVYLEHDDIVDLRYELYNEQGQMILTKAESEPYHTYMLSLAAYPAGIYFLHVTHPDGRRYVERLVRVE